MASSNGCVEEASVLQEDPPVQNSVETKDKAAEPAADTKRNKSIKANKRLTGTVKWFNVKDGFGFITRHDTGEDVFVHQSCILRPNSRHSVPSVGEGEVVEFGLIASKVTGPGFKRVKGSAYVRPKRFGDGGARDKPKSGASVRSRRGARRDSKNGQGTTNNQPVGDGPIVKEMAQLKIVEYDITEIKPANLAQELSGIQPEHHVPEVVSIKEEPDDVEENEDDDDDTVSVDSTSTVATAESAD